MGRPLVIDPGRVTTGVLVGGRDAGDPSSQTHSSIWWRHKPRSRTPASCSSSVVASSPRDRGPSGPNPSYRSRCTTGRAVPHGRQHPRPARPHGDLRGGREWRRLGAVWTPASTRIVAPAPHLPASDPDFHLAVPGDPGRDRPSGAPPSRPRLVPARPYPWPRATRMGRIRRAWAGARRSGAGDAGRQ